MKKIFLMYCCFFLTGFLFAQNTFRVSGVVIGEEDDLPVIGANVMVKGTAQGTAQGTVTDLDGRFELNVPANATLTISYIGYKPFEQRITASSNSMRVVLANDAKMLDEVVAIGYGTMKKSDLTGAIGSVSGKDLKTMPVAKVDQALQGRISGVTVNSNSGQPGADATVRIRGIGTLNGSNPIYVVDGVITDNINFLSSSDIVSLEVLKDASATAIYGSRGANGVILITTKKGDKDGKSNITFESYFGVQNRWKKMDVVGRDEQANFLATFGVIGTKDELDRVGLNEWIRNNLTPDNDAYFPRIMTVDPATGLPGGADPNGIDYTKIDTDWQDEIFVKDATIQNYYLSVDGGNDKANYMMSANYFDQDGILIGSSYKRLTLRINTSFQIKSWLRVGENLSFSNSHSYHVQGNGNTALISSALSMGPWDPVKYPEGTYSNSTRRNPVRDLSGQYSIPSMKRQVTNPYVQVFNSTPYNNSDDWVGNLYAEITPIKGLILRGDVGMKLWNGMSRTFSPELDVIYNASTRNSVSSRMERSQQLTYTGTATYSKTINEKHDITAMFGMTSENSDYYMISASGYHLENTDPKNWYISATPLNEIRQNPDGSYYSTRSGGDGVSKGRMASYLGRFHYVYDNKYLLTANLRYDGSSKFDRGRMWKLFPSIAGAWKISEEDFFGPLEEVFDILKVRVGWGRIGNDSSVGQTSFMTRMNTFTARYPLGTPNSIYQGRTLTGYPMTGNWEITEQTDFGFDFGMFNGLLSGTIDLYQRNTFGMLMEVQPPGHVGFMKVLGSSYPTGNVATVRNRGLELNLEHRNKIGKFSYSLGGNISFVNNELTKLNGGEKIIDGIIRQDEGFALNTIYTWVYDGVFQTQEEIDNYTWTNPETGEVKKIQDKAKPGDAKYLDLNNDGLITDLDRKDVGSGFPTVTYGFNVGADFKGFDLQVFFQGVGGVQVFNGTRQMKLESDGNSSVLSTDMRNVYYPGVDPNDPTRIINVMQGSNGSIPNPTATAGSADNNIASSRFVENASYLRLKNMQFGYTIPRNITSKLHVERLRVYIGGSNLLTFTKYKGFDPEVGNNGRDYGNYPQARTVLLGLNVNF